MSTLGRCSRSIISSTRLAGAITSDSSRTLVPAVNSTSRRLGCPRCGLASYTGGCHCGDVKFKAEGKPNAVVNCHCSVCRRIHSATYAPLVVYDTEKLTVTKGADKLAKYVTGKEDRYFCKRCASKIYSQLNHLKCRAAFLQNFDGHGPDGKIRSEFKPQFHIFYGSGTIDVHDGLPKYDTLPAALGGSDKQLSEDYHSTR